MASSKAQLQYLLDQLSDLEEITYRPMMGEYLLYFRGKLVAGIYDDRLLVKPTPMAKQLLPNAPMEPPYPGAKEMLLVEEIDDKPFLAKLIQILYEALPEPKKKAKK